MSDTLEEMKIRAAFKHLTYPYLYDGETQATARAYGPQATPHVFIFDRQRRLCYEGRLDSSYREELVKMQDARNAIDALLAGQPVAVAHTGVFGCSTKWKEKQAERLEALRKLDEKPVTLEPASGEEIKRLLAHESRKLTLMSFWSPRCDICLAQFAEIETTYRMYSPRGLDLVTVAVEPLTPRAAVEQMLEKQHATSRNLLAPEWSGSLPYTVVLTPDGRTVYQKTGAVDMLELRRAILANIDYLDYPCCVAGIAPHRRWLGATRRTQAGRVFCRSAYTRPRTSLRPNLPDPNSGHDSFVVVLDISIARQAPAARNPLELNGFFAIHTRAQSDEIITATCFRSKERRV